MLRHERYQKKEMRRSFCDAVNLLNLMVIIHSELISYSSWMSMFKHENEEEKVKNLKAHDEIIEAVANTKRDVKISS